MEELVGTEKEYLELERKKFFGRTWMIMVTFLIITIIMLAVTFAGKLPHKTSNASPRRSLFFLYINQIQLHLLIAIPLVFLQIKDNINRVAVFQFQLIFSQSKSN